MLTEKMCVVESGWVQQKEVTLEEPFVSWDASNGCKKKCLTTSLTFTQLCQAEVMTPCTKGACPQKETSWRMQPGIHVHNQALPP